jgi:hypothetical protein
MSFVPADYVAPSTSSYTKLQAGENNIRIISEMPLIAFQYWNTAGKPVRSLKHPGQPADIRRDDKGQAEAVKECWWMAVYNFATKQMEIWEVSQAGIKNKIINLSQDSDYGHPSGYTLKIVKSGSGLETKYDVTPRPPKALDASIQAVVDAAPANLEAILTGGNPFDTQPKPGAAPTPEQKQNQAPGDNDLPF